MASLDGIQLLIEDEDGDRGVDATSYAVEKGEPFTDHVKKRPKDFSIKGYLLSDNWQADLQKLETAMENGKFLKYVGKNTLTDVIILSIRDGHNSDVANGFAVTISLRKVRITKTSWQKAPPAAKPVTNTGQKKPVPKTATASPVVYHVVKKGNTYWGLSKKYGTSISQLRTWNKYPDRAIPIGVKLRVK